jgi:hypothetical protein
VGEPVNEGHGAGRVREHLGPVAKGLGAAAQARAVELTATNTERRFGSRRAR